MEILEGTINVKYFCFVLGVFFEWFVRPVFGVIDGQNGLVIFACPPQVEDAKSREFWDKFRHP